MVVLVRTTSCIHVSHLSVHRCGIGFRACGINDERGVTEALPRCFCKTKNGPQGYDEVPQTESCGVSLMVPGSQRFPTNRRRSLPVDRINLVLAALVAGGKEARYNAVQVENLLLLIDREAADEIGGPYFAFAPTKYGPYDVAVLETVERLAAAGSAVINEAGPYWACFASETGYDRGVRILAGMPAPVRRYLRKAARWILTEPFWSMMAGIYRRYPEMAVKSGIPQSALRDAGRTRKHPFLAGMASLVGIFSRRAQARSGSGTDPAVIESDWWAVGDDIRYALDHANAARG